MSKSKQITLFEGDDTYRNIQKHSWFVQMGNLQTLLQRKLMNVSIRISRDQLKRDPNQKRFGCEISILRRLTGFKDGNNEELKEALKALRRSEFEYNIMNKDKEEWGNFSFFADVQINSYGRGKTAYVYWEYPQRVLNEIKDPSMYVTLNLLILLLLNSKHSITLYENLKDYIRLWKIRYSPNDFKRIMGIKETQYKSFSMLKGRVIEKALAEINEKTDLAVKFEIEKIGNKPHSIQFYMKLNKKGVLVTPNNDEIKKKLIAFDFSEKEINTLLKNHDTQYLLANIIVVEERIKKGESIRKPKSYLTTAFVKDFRKPTTEFSIIQKQKEEEKQQKIETEKKEKLEEAILKGEYEESKKSSLHKAKKTLSPSDLAILKEEFDEKMLSNSALSIAYSKGFDHEMVQAMWNKFQIDKLLPTELHSFENFKANKNQVDNYPN